MSKRGLLLTLLVAGWFASAAPTTAPGRKPRPTGVFSDMHSVAAVGDVVGTEVVIVYSTNGLNGEYWAFVQMAEGAPAPPILVKADVTNDEVEFTLPDSMGGRFVGRVSTRALVGKFERFTNTTTLLRGKSYWQ